MVVKLPASGDKVLSDQQSGMSAPSPLSSGLCPEERIEKDMPISASLGWLV